MFEAPSADVESMPPVADSGRELTSSVQSVESVQSRPDVRPGPAIVQPRPPAPGQHTEPRAAAVPPAEVERAHTVEVVIGRIEVRAAPPPPTAPVTPAHATPSFEAYRRIRSYADRGWY